MRVFTRVALFVFLLVAVAPPAAAVPAVPKLKKKQAVRAVTREVRVEHGIDYPDVGCSRLSRLKMKCRFEGLTDADIREGNIGGHRGIAYVRRYESGIDVRITAYRDAY